MREGLARQRTGLCVASELYERIDRRIGSAESGSMLIHGHNDRALDAFGGSIDEQVKCIYIDPPYNNNETYNHYDDRQGHEDWLNSVTIHLAKLLPLLSPEGSIWVSIDDYQVHYLKVAMDGIFGRENFLTTIVWEHRKTRENRKTFSNNHEYIIAYAKDAKRFKKSRNRLPYGEEVKQRYRNPDNDPRGPWQSISLNVQAGHATASQFYTISSPAGKIHTPPNGRCWMYTKERVQQLLQDNRIWFGKSGAGVPRLKRFLSEMDGGLTPHTLWTADEVGTTDSAKKSLLAMFPDFEVFDTPKPEGLISRIIQIATNPGDLVLDSYLGSGTTAAVSLKTGRRFVGIEQGDHINTICYPRIKATAMLQGQSVKFYTVV